MGVSGNLGGGGGGGAGTLTSFNGDVGPAIVVALDDIATAEPTGGDVDINGHKLVGLAPGTASADAATVGQALQALTATAIKTANYDPANGELALYDTTSGSLTGTLPAAAAGKVLGVKMVTQGATNTVTLTCAGTDRINKAGGSTTVTLKVLGEARLLLGTASGTWVAWGDDLPLAQLDLRFAPITGIAESAVAGLVADLAAKAAAAGPAFTGHVTVPDGTNATDAVSKQQLDAVASNVPNKAECKYGTTVALPAVTYANGASGVGATLTANANGALSMDGASPAVADSVLVKNQVAAAQNGVYTVTVAGDGSTAFVLTRRTDFDTAAEVNGGDNVFVQAGTTNGNTTWTLSVSGAVVVGTTSLPWVQVGGPGSVTAGTGISVTGNQVAVDTAVVARKSDKLSAFAATSSAELAGVLGDETGSGPAVFANAPALVKPTADAFVATGLTGAVAAARFVGGTASGAPTTGTFAVGDFVVDQVGAMWVCTVAGTPGTWVNPTTQISSVALELLLNEVTLYEPNTALKGNTSLYVVQNQTFGLLPKVSSISANGTIWTVTFASSILGTLGAVGDTFHCWTAGFTPSGWNTGSLLAPVIATITSSTTATIPNATSPAAATVTGQVIPIPQQYHTGNSAGGGPPAIVQLQGTNTFTQSADALYGIGPVWQNQMFYTNASPFSGTFTVTNGSPIVTIAGDHRDTIYPKHKAVVNLGTPPAQDTSKLAAVTTVVSVGYDGTNTIVTLGSNWLGSTGTATIFFPSDVTTGEGMVNNPLTQARGGSVVSFPTNSSTFAKPGEGQGWSLGYWHGPIFKAFSSASSLINVNDCAHALLSFFDQYSVGLQRLGLWVDDAYTARNTLAHLGSVAKQIAVAVGTMTADAADYYPYTGALTAPGNIGILNASTTVHPPAPAVCYTTATQTLNQVGATITVDSTAGFPATGTLNGPVAAQAAGHFTAIAYTGRTATTFTGCTIASGSLALTNGVVLFSANKYQDVSAGTFTVQAYGTTAALSSTASVSATTAASAISTGAPLYAGQILEIINVSPAGINHTFTGGATSGLQLGGGGTRVLGSGGTLRLKWSAALSLWCEDAYSGGDYSNVAPGTPFIDLGKSYVGNGSTTPETSILNGGAAIAAVFPAGVSVGDFWTIRLRFTLLNNSGTNTYTSRIRTYFGAYPIDDVTSQTLTSSATTRICGIDLTVVVETLGAGGVGTLRVSGRRFGLDTSIGVGTGFRTIAGNVYAEKVSESTGTSAAPALVTNAAQALNVTATHSNATALMTTALTECIINYFPKHS